MALVCLPIELLYDITDHLHQKKDLNAFVQTTYQLHQNFNKHLYRFDRRCCGSSALLWATTRGNIRTALISLAERAGTLTEDKCLDAALQLAVENGCCEMAGLLVDNGANVNASVDYFGTMLQIASWLSAGEIAKLLIDRGADINAKGGRYGSALQAASWVGNEKTTELLLSHCVDANIQGGYFGNPLQGAAWGGNLRVTTLLIEHGANVNAQGGHYGNALQAAS
jgi:ankyrin repeat protein